MADEQYRWLNRETAEALLRGESPDTVDAATRDQAERLAATLNALSAATVAADVELPGEAAALAAFRKARAEQADPGTAADRRTRRFAGADDAGVVRIGGRPSGPRRARWGRPVRFAVSAALAVGAVGGVAAAATTGVLPTPFGVGEPGPAASVEGSGTPDRVSGSPSPGGRSRPAVPGSPTGGPSGGATAGDGPAASPGADPGPDDAHGVPGGQRRMASACRDLRDGESLAPGRKRALERAAGGAGHVEAYCRGVLRPADPGSTGKGGKGGNGQDKSNKGRAEDTGGGNSGGKGNGHGQGGGNAAEGQGGQKDEKGKGGDDGNH
ncbi:extensin [Streptomyces sp. NPDC003697]